MFAISHNQDVTLNLFQGLSLKQLVIRCERMLKRVQHDVLKTNYDVERIFIKITLEN